MVLNCFFFSFYCYWKVTFTERDLPSGWFTPQAAATAGAEPRQSGARSLLQVTNMGAGS